MSKEQIEEMAREMCHLSAECKTCQICNERYHGDDDDLCYFQCVAKEIINHGYRKQSENTVDVVRCKDCHWFKPYKKPVEDFDGRCDARGCETDEEEFCSYGARMKGGAE